MPGTTPYLTLSDFKQISVVPAQFIEEIELRTPGWVEQRIRMISAYIDTRLSKRYATPFQDPCPFAVRDWIAKIVSMDCWLRRGVEPTDTEISEYKAQQQQAYDELKEAANSDTGLFDLPLRSDVDGTGISRGAPLATSQQSPYAWTTEQARIGRQEDQGTR